MQVLAFTSGGDGVKSAPIHCQTEQDGEKPERRFSRTRKSSSFPNHIVYTAPEAPIAIKALVMSSESILVSWRPPSQPNGVITQYTVYTKADNAEEPSSQKVPPNQLTHEASELDKTRRYDFWVTASTNIGEGEASKIVALAPSVRGISTPPLSSSRRARHNPFFENCFSTGEDRVVRRQIHGHLQRGREITLLGRRRARARGDVESARRRAPIQRQTATTARRIPVHQGSGPHRRRGILLLRGKHVRPRHRHPPVDRAR